MSSNFGNYSVHAYHIVKNLLRTCSACFMRLSLDITLFFLSKSGDTLSWPASVAPNSGTESSKRKRARSRSNDVT